MNRKKVAILYICTGEYILFWKPFYISFSKNFLSNSDVHYYVFTDATDVYMHQKENVHVIYKEHEEWPYITLNRFDTFLMIEKELLQYDYCFFTNANLFCYKKISESEILIEDKLIVTQHPGFSIEKKDKMAWESRKESLAYVNSKDAKVYIAGGFNGGETKIYLEMVKELSNNINIDKKNGIIAKVHDESHINHYIIENQNYQLLGAEYLFPQGAKLSVECKIMIWDKRLIFNVGKFKKYVSQGTADSNFAKYLLLYNTLNQFIYIKNSNLNLKSFFQRNGYKTIALYGYKGMGEILLDDFKKSELPVQYIVDKVCRETQEGRKIVAPENLQEQKSVDCIVVACADRFFEVSSELYGKIDCTLLPIDYIVHEVYMDYIKQEKDSCL